MDKICKQYLKEIKALLPLKQKAERKYLKKLKADIDDYCKDTSITSKQELYENYGTPAEVVRNYITSMDTSALMKRLKVSKTVRTCAVALIIAIIVATCAFCLNQYLIKKVWNDNVVGSYYTETIVILEVIE